MLAARYDDDDTHTHTHTHTYIYMEVNNENESDDMKKIEKRINPKMMILL